jgi:hypothetical protein
LRTRTTPVHSRRGSAPSRPFKGWCTDLPKIAWWSVIISLVRASRRPKWHFGCKSPNEHPRGIWCRQSLDLRLRSGFSLGAIARPAQAYLGSLAVSPKPGKLALCPSVPRGFGYILSNASCSIMDSGGARAAAVRPLCCRTRLLLLLLPLLFHERHFLPLLSSFTSLSSHLHPRNTLNLRRLDFFLSIVALHWDFWVCSGVGSPRATEVVPISWISASIRSVSGPSTPSRHFTIHRPNNSRALTPKFPTIQCAIVKGCGKGGSQSEHFQR